MGDDVSSAKELEVSNTKKISIKNTSHTKDPRTSNWTGNEVERLSAVRSLAFPNLCRAFYDSIISFSPNDFFVMQKSMKEDASRPTLKAVIALLKLSHWDPDVFYKFRDVILQQVSACTLKLRNDLCRNPPWVWAHLLLWIVKKMWLLRSAVYTTVFECTKMPFNSIGLQFFAAVSIMSHFTTWGCVIIRLVNLRLLWRILTEHFGSNMITLRQKRGSRSY